MSRDVFHDGHTFGPDLRCRCHVTWEEHQANPATCPKPTSRAQHALGGRVQPHEVTRMLELRGRGLDVNQIANEVRRSPRAVRSALERADEGQDGGAAAREGGATPRSD